METRLSALELAQNYVADAMCAFHEQLAAAFRGDPDGCRRAHQRAAYATAEAIRTAKVAFEGLTSPPRPQPRE